MTHNIQTQPKIFPNNKYDLKKSFMFNSYHIISYIRERSISISTLVPWTVFLLRKWFEGFLVWYWIYVLLEKYWHSGFYLCFMIFIWNSDIGYKFPGYNYKLLIVRNMFSQFSCILENKKNIEIYYRDIRIIVSIYTFDLTPNRTWIQNKHWWRIKC